MISVHEAEALILQHTMAFPTELTPLSQCDGRVLREDLVADRDFPPFDRVTMDGIAIAYAEWEKGLRRFPVESIVAAGTAQAQLRDPAMCMEIMTGAILPGGCDTVIRYEDININNNVAEIVTPDVRHGQNVHRKGEDRRQGEVIVLAGTQLSIAEIGVAATIGKTRICVSALPKVAIVSTGDELVKAEATPLPHQIRQSNVRQIHTLMAQRGIHAEVFHIPDSPSVIQSTIASILPQFDLFILSGGVSAGRYDYIPETLVALDVHEVFHKIAQRPGKPFWFGISAQGNVVFALPGNPVSTVMCAVRYILPWLDASLGILKSPRYAALTQDYTFTPPLTCFLPVKLTFEKNAVCAATPVKGHGSGDLASLVYADAFLELPAGKDTYGKGENFKVWVYREG